MSGFAWHRRSGRVIATFHVWEADLLRTLASQLVELLRHDTAAAPTQQDPLEALLDFGGPTTEPEDPVLARLLPSAYRDDEEAAGDFRRYTESALRDGKVEAALTIVGMLEEAGLPPEPDDDSMVIDVELDRPAALTWMRSLTDLRLAIATRLGVQDGDEAYWHSLPDDDPRTQTHDVYEWLGYLQETLVQAVAAHPPKDR